MSATEAPSYVDARSLMDDFSQRTSSISGEGRSVLIIAVAVLIIILGIVVLVYRSALFAPASAPLPGTANATAQPALATPEQKLQILQQVSAQLQTQSAPTSTQNDRTKVLQSTQSEGQATAPPPPSSAEKMKLLQSLQH